MSGFIGVLQLNRAPVDQGWLQAATAGLAFRGPDAQASWSEGPVGLGYALLRTVRESEEEYQPFSPDGQVWGVGDVRLDGRGELIEKLVARGCPVQTGSPDIELVLHAYSAWGQQCLDYLMGDFACAIWDERTGQLFCARDQFGVAPFYYAMINETFICSNILACLLTYPGVPDTLNEEAIGDYLLVGYNFTLSTTTYQAIQRLPPAHFLRVGREGLQVQRYWQAPDTGRYVRYRRDEEVVEHFSELFSQAVADRIRGDRIAVHLSGGMDSTSVAATAHGILTGRGKPFEMQAHTMVLRHIMPDDEESFARQVAEKLGIPMLTHVTDEESRPQPSNDAAVSDPASPSSIPGLRQNDIPAVSTGFRVLLTGLGGDPLLFPVPSYWRNLLRRGSLPQAWADLRRYFHWHGRFPPLYFRSAMLRRFGKPGWQRPMPPWILPDFARRIGLAARLVAIHQQDTGMPLQQGMADAPFWCHLFELADPGYHRRPIKYSHPFFDLRLYRFILSVPPVPWFENKLLLRAAMRGILPAAVLQRRKTHLAQNPLQATAQQRGVQPWMEELAQVPELSAYVDQNKLLQAIRSPGAMPGWQYRMVMLPLGLASWLRDRNRSKDPGQQLYSISHVSL